ncbi:histone-lysine N-methyltransferase EHMT2 [Nephila pilipes]|uniref:Histone-lysine N-methyltransferase EHMT2 n=1 Tax=Nephila pilipes TaxID=299642 RepID=A0A8X6NVD0_NEPPI|nr:histone-lysine N-methyltransferase EHMT2 [Nephila pilipes]
MQNQNFWNGSYSPSEYSEKYWMTSAGRSRDEFCSSYSINSESHPIGYDEFFIYSNDIPSNSVNNMELATQPSTIPSNNIKLRNASENDFFAENSSFVESLDSALSYTKHSDEKHISCENGQLLSDSEIVSFNVSQSKDDLNPSLSSISKISKRRNSLPSNYAYDKQLSIDSELKPIYCSDFDEINSSCSPSDINKGDSNDNTSWTNCYAPYRKHPVSAVSSERGLDSLVNKLFTDEQKKRYLELKRKKMENKKEENKQIDVDAAYKSFLEGMAGTSQNDSSFDNRDVACDNDKTDDDKMFLFENSTGDCMIDTVSTEVDINSKNSEQKPFTVAKKSVIEKTAFKTVIQSYFGIRTAMKTYNKSSDKKVQSANIVDKDGSAIIVTLQDKSDLDSSIEDLSSDETKNSIVSWSPLKDLKLSKSVCCCSANEIPCLCNGEQLQLICEAEDTIDENIVPCTRTVSQQYLLTPSSEIKYRAFCDIHLWRLKKHHCCPKCGIFCTQGSFLYCYHSSNGENENHFFHSSCFLIPDVGLPPGCPHCCRFSNFKNVNLTFFEKEDHQAINTNSYKVFNAQNLTEDLENYNILMDIQNSEVECSSNVNSAFLMQKRDLKTMLMAVSEETSLRLRPAGKCLFNPIKTNDVKKVLQLIANGVNPNHKFTTHKNNTPLHVAAFYGSTGIVHVLLQCEALIDAVNDDLETPLILAVEKEQISVVRYLIHAGAQVDVKNENGLTAFHVACKNNSKEMAEFLFNTGKFDVNLQDDGGWTPLVWACEHNYVDLIQWLLDLGADPNVRDNEENTALHWAACSGNNDILEMLLDNGCNLSFVNQRGDSALHIAARKDNYMCVKLLLARDALLDCVNKEGETPLMCCDKDSRSRRILNKHLTSAKSECNSLQQRVVFRDISRGTEKYPIQAVNEVDQEEFIMDFRYITRNCYAPNIDVITTVDSMQLCYCKDNCSSRDCTCTSISKCWYDMDGRLLSDFDMYDPPSIYECNKTCHCPKSCINRVVQQGLRHPLQLFRTLNRGWGVRTLKDLSKGTFVCEYVGEVISEDEISRRADDSYFFDLESRAIEHCIDGRFFGNIARFINHSCDPNLVCIRVFVEHQDLNFPRIAFFTTRDVQAFDELCFDYGIEFWIAKSQTVLCICNSDLCKYSKDSIDVTLQAYVNEKQSQMLESIDA